MEYSKCLGSFGEEFAVRVLMEMGFVIHDTNYKTRHGEIDIIAKKGSTLHFIEVKTRSTDSCGAPEDAVDDRKLERMKAAADDYIRRKRPGWRDISFDVFAISTDVIWDVA